MTEQEQLSEAYSDIKEKYVLLLEKTQRQSDSNKALSGQILTLKNEVKSLEEVIASLRAQLETVNDEIVHQLPKKSVNGNYVSLRRYRKIQSMASEYAKRFGDQERIITELRNKLLEYKTLQK